MLPALPNADLVIADSGYDVDWFRAALENQDIEPRMPGRKGRRGSIEYDQERYRERNLIERMFGKLKDSRRISTR